jgi:transposase-like protein
MAGWQRILSDLQLVRTPEVKHPAVAGRLDAAREDLIAFVGFPREIWSNNPQERLDKEIRRRTGVVGILPDRPSIGWSGRYWSTRAGARRLLFLPSSRN